MQVVWIEKADGLLNQRILMYLMWAWIEYDGFIWV